MTGSPEQCEANHASSRAILQIQFNDDSGHRYADALISLLWGDQVDRVRSGDIIRIENGWCRMSQGQKVVSTGRTGRLTVLAA